MARHITNDSKQRADWSIERASNQVQTMLSSSRSAWSRSRRRRGRRPHGMLGVALKIEIIDGMARNKAWDNALTLKRASRSHAKTGLWLELLEEQTPCCF